MSNPNNCQKYLKYGEDLIIELQKLNPFGYREEKALSPPEEKLTLEAENV